MQAFALTENVSLNTPGFFRQYMALPAQSGKTEVQADMSRVYLSLYGEVQLVSEDLRKKHGKKEQTLPAGLLSFSEQSLAAWPQAPALLGRVSSRYHEGEVLHTHTEAAPLAGQVQALRERQPDKQHFRIALINGFGITMNDAVMGMTALRHAARVLEENLPDFSMDVLLGPAIGPMVEDVLRQIPCVEQIFHLGPTMQDMARYDAVFDTTEVFSLPRYGEMNPADWYLWWFGLDPAAIPAEEKRNSMRVLRAIWQGTGALVHGQDLPADVTEESLAALPEYYAYDGKKRVFFCSQSGQLLTDFPPAHAACFARQLLDEDPDLLLIPDLDLGIQHERLLPLMAKIDSSEKFKALVGHVDGVISIDSFAAHLADAAGTPTVFLQSIVPANWYPYYPFARSICLPGAENLPCWQKPRISAEEWQAAEDEYGKAWEALSPSAVLAALNEVMQARKGAQGARAGLALLTLAELMEQHSHKGPFPHERVNMVWAYAQQRMIQVAAQMLRPGATAVAAGAGLPELPATLARMVAPYGHVHIFEPRRLRAQALGGAFTQAGIYNAQVYQHMPVPGGKSISLPDTDPWTETDPAFWGNEMSVTQAAASPLDSLQLSRCQVITIQPPMPVQQVLNGAVETLRRCRPALIMSPVTQAEAGPLCKMLQPLGYTLWAETALPQEEGAQPDMSMLFLLGLPNEVEVNLQGFVKVELA